MINKTNSFSSALYLAGLLAIGLGCSLRASLPINYSFDDFAVDSKIVGQDGWQNFSSDGGTGPRVREVAASVGAVPAIIKGLGNSGESTPSRAFRSFGNMGLNAASTLVVEFDMMRVRDNGQALLGVGIVDPAQGAVGHPASVGTFSTGGFLVRGEGEGNQHYPVDANGFNVVPHAGELYRVRSVWTLAGSGNATLEIKNLSRRETDFTQLFFDRAQTQATADLGLYSNPSSWQHLWIRSGGTNTQAGFIRNISVSKYQPSRN
jgi:hypothetical protein